MRTMPAVFPLLSAAFCATLLAGVVAGCRSDLLPPTSDLGASDGGGDAAVACGDATVVARFAACTASRDRAACEAAGGSWTRVGLSPNPSCLCPTGQAGCTCTRSGTCFSGCIERLNGGVGPDACRGVVAGHCAPDAPLVGCWCMFDEQGNVAPMCID